jgi:hypothetical protein
MSHCIQQNIKLFHRFLNFIFHQYHKTAKKQTSTQSPTIQPTDENECSNLTVPFFPKIIIGFTFFQSVFTDPLV